MRLLMTIKISATVFLVILNTVEMGLDMMNVAIELGATERATEGIAELEEIGGRFRLVSDQGKIEPLLKRTNLS
jgi:hypothetical protein